MNFVDTLISPESEVRLEETLFRAGMWWRIFYGILRIILGTALLRLVDTSFADLVYQLLKFELIEDPTDFLIRVVYPLVEQHSFTISYFIAAHLLFWGFIDVIFSSLLLRHKLWAFPVSIALISVFVLYEIYRVSYTHSLFLAGVIIVDLFVILLTYREYKRLELKLHTYAAQ